MMHYKSIGFCYNKQLNIYNDQHKCISINNLSLSISSSYILMIEEKAPSLFDQ